MWANTQLREKRIWAGLVGCWAGMHGPAQATKDKVGLGCRGRVGQKRLQAVEFLEKQRRIWLLILFEFEENDLKNSNQDLNLFKNRDFRICFKGSKFKPTALNFKSNEIL
jgi:hypothetical protein